MKSVIVVLLLLCSCIVIVPSEQDNVSTIIPVNDSPILVNESEVESESIGMLMNFTDGPVVDVPAQVIVVDDLSIGEQHKMIPLLESAVKNSSCFKVNWVGIENYSNIPLTTKQELRFEYLGAKQFKGWILNILYLFKDEVASGTNSVMVDDLIVSCVDKPDFSVEWNKVQIKYDFVRR